LAAINDKNVQRLRNPGGGFVDGGRGVEWQRTGRALCSVSFTPLSVGTRVSLHPHRPERVDGHTWVRIAFRDFTLRRNGWFRMDWLTQVVSGGGSNAGSSQLVTAKMMSDFGWPVNATELTLVNKVLRDYGITDMRSIHLFFATCAHESKFGAKVLELLNLDGTVAGVGYEPSDRGAGYIQLTGRALHLLFLGSDK